MKLIEEKEQAKQEVWGRANDHQLIDGLYTEELRKCRRNLLVFSTVLVSVHVGGLDLQNVNLQGLKIENDAFFSTLCFLATLYFASVFFWHMRGFSAKLTHLKFEAEHSASLFWGPKTNKPTQTNLLNTIQRLASRSAIEQQKTKWEAGALYDKRKLLGAVETRSLFDITVPIVFAFCALSLHLLVVSVFDHSTSLWENITRTACDIPLPFTNGETTNATTKHVTWFRYAATSVAFILCLHFGRRFWPRAAPRPVLLFFYPLPFILVLYFPLLWGDYYTTASSCYLDSFNFLQEDSRMKLYGP